MIPGIKECVDKNDIKGLRYIFINSLDVDPTFEEYRDGYELSKSIEGFFQPYQELTPLTNDKSMWNRQYWEQLEIDLNNNFAEERLEHMFKVANVFYAKKCDKLKQERKLEEAKRTFEAENQRIEAKLQVKRQRTVPPTDASKHISQKALQDKKIEEKKRAYAVEYQRIEAKQQAQKERIEAAKRKRSDKKNVQEGEEKSKKWLGIVLVVLVALVLVLLIIILH